jgi:hypothetical protein
LYVVGSTSGLGCFDGLSGPSFLPSLVGWGIVGDRGDGYAVDSTYSRLKLIKQSSQRGAQKQQSGTLMIRVGVRVTSTNRPVVVRSALKVHFDKHSE